MKLEEQVGWKSGVTIDREAGVIRGVKILGATSTNGRLYPAEVRKAARPMYEGQGVNLDHVADDEKRRVLDGFGRLSNVQEREDGLYGDLEYLRKHPYSEQFLEAAERMPEQVGLSHSAFGEVKMENGMEVVEAIHKVKSVDLVRYPASTKGLFESEGESSPRKQLRAAVLSVLDESSLSIDQVRGKIMSIAESQAPEGTPDEPKPDGGTPPTPPAPESPTPPVEEPTPTEEPEPKETSESQLAIANEKLAMVEAKFAELRHDMAVLECVQAHRIDLASLSEDQAKELRGKKDRSEMDAFAESLPAALKHGVKPAMPGGKDDFDAIHEEMASVYGFRSV